MDLEKEKYFKEKYPLLFFKMHNKDYHIGNSCMAWGIEFGNGWFDILDRLCAKLEPLAAQYAENNPDSDYWPCFDQLKEKYGEMRAYLSCETQEMWNLINEAEEESGRTCEICGKPGTLNAIGWISCLCDECRRPRKKPEADAVQGNGEKPEIASDTPE